MNMRRPVTFLVVAMLGAMFGAQGVSATQAPSVSMDLTVDASDCSTVVLSADIDWRGLKLTAYPDYMIEWFAVGSFSQTLGTTAFDPGKRAGKRHGSIEASFTRDGYFDALIYQGSSYSAALRVVATGSVVATSNLVPVPVCAQAIPDAASSDPASPDPAGPDIPSPDTDPVSAPNPAG